LNHRRLPDLQAKALIHDAFADGLMPVCFLPKASKAELWLPEFARRIYVSRKVWQFWRSLPCLLPCLFQRGVFTRHPGSNIGKSKTTNGLNPTVRRRKQECSRSPAHFRRTNRCAAFSSTRLLHIAFFSTELMWKSPPEIVFHHFRTDHLSCSHLRACS
jgi:hypothetical protein